MKGLKLVVIGAGSSYTPELMEGIIKRQMNFRSANYGWLILRMVVKKWRSLRP